MQYSSTFFFIKHIYFIKYPYNLLRYFYHSRSPKRSASNSKRKLALTQEKSELIEKTHNSWIFRATLASDSESSDFDFMPS